MSDIAFLDHTARKPNVRLDIIAERKPSQLNESSAAEASDTPSCTVTTAALHEDAAKEVADGVKG